MTMNSRFIAVAQDPRIIPGVHHYCDEWCDYCPVTHRCLAFRCTIEYRKERGRREGEPTFGSLDEAVAFTKEVAALEGMPTEELDALLGNPPGHSGIETKDPLASLAWDYAMRVALWLAPLAHDALAQPTSLAEPTPVKVLLWYHVRIYMKIFRALVAKERTASGVSDRAEEAAGCAKLALVSVQRSRSALASAGLPAPANEIARLEAMLADLERGIHERFPQAQTFLRIGLDVPAAA
jgi:hypothetical protein